MAPTIYSIVLLALGALLALVGFILLLVAAFRESVLWGLIVIFAPLGSFIYTCVHWSQAKAGFLASLVGTFMCIGAVITLTDSRGVLAQVAAQHQIPGWAGEAGPKAAAGVDLNAQIAEKRQSLETLQAAFAHAGRDLPAEYQQLEKRRKVLKTGDEAAITKFNEDAAAYQARNTKLKEMQKEITGKQAALDQLLDARSRAKVPGAGTSAGARSASAKKVVMYSTSHCPACKVAKQYLTQKGIPYQEIDVETSREGQEAFQRLGGTGVPLIVVGEKKMTGFNSQELERMLL
jgi:glutaredoxin